MRTLVFLWISLQNAPKIPENSKNIYKRFPLDCVYKVSDSIIEN